MPNESIYDGPRLAQPDEVANYNTGDGIEKAFTLANILLNRDPDIEIKLMIDKKNIVLKGQKEYIFNSLKGLKKQLRISKNSCDVIE
jgi:hypothetical protein